jgi:hypothetical protein
MCILSYRQESCLKTICHTFLLLFLPLTDIQAGNTQTVYVARISWHTGIIVPISSMPDSIWPSGLNVSNFDYLEIGWGDRDYYPHPRFNLWYAFKAIFWPTKTVLHVFPLKERHVPDTYANTRLAKLTLDSTELRYLAEFLLSQFEYDHQGKIIPVENGFYPNSQFFAGCTKYYFPKNSNVWAAMALKQAGLKFIPIFYQTAGMVVNRAASLRGKESALHGK